MKLASVVTVVLMACSSSKSGPAEDRLLLTYELDLAIAIDDKAAEIIRDLDAALAAERITARVTSSVAAPGAVTVTADVEQRAAIEKLIQASYADAIAPRACEPSDGLDAICFVITESYGHAVKKAALARAVEIVRARIGTTGVSGSKVAERNGAIVVEFAASPDQAMAARSAIARGGRLGLHIVDDGSDYMQRVYAHVGSDASDGIAADVDMWREPGGSTHSDYYLTARDRDQVLGARVIEKYLTDLAATDPRFAIPPDRKLAFELVQPLPDARDKRPYWRSYYLHRTAQLTGASIVNAEPATDPNTNRPLILVDLDKKGADRFGDLTAENVGRKIAIVLDDRITSAPIINGEIRGGRLSIMLGDGEPARLTAERDELVKVLKSGALPAPLVESAKIEIPAGK